MKENNNMIIKEDSCFVIVLIRGLLHSEEMDRLMFVLNLRTEPAEFCDLTKRDKLLQWLKQILFCTIEYYRNVNGARSALV